jgi:dihydroorotate dehydrogenase electron transfer subunit
MPMIKALKAICSETRVRLYVSLEERMACGTGLCRGCAVRASQGPEEKYLHVCLEGPVFRAEDVVLGGEA